MSKRDTFGGRMSVIFAMAGSAIGLGNIWRFPYMVGEHGGAAFILLYICATLLISLPVFIAEVVLGRRSRTSAYGSMSKLSSGSKVWKYAGLLAVIIPTFITSYYSVIGGWSLAYFLKACSLQFIHSSPETVSGIFGTFISSAWYPPVMHMIFLASCAFVVAMGVNSGIERFSKTTIPVLFCLIVMMIIYSVTLPGASDGVKYIFKPDFSQINARSFAYAMGQSFYSLSLGMGAIITYGSYVSKDENIVASSVGTAVSDLMFAILAALAIMPAVFAAGIEPGAGPGLIFQSIPFIFSSMGQSIPVFSSIAAIIFFLTIIVAAMTSCISILEVGVAYLNEKHGIARWKGSIILFFICGIAGIFCSLSFGPLSGATVGGMGIFDIFDWLSSNIMLLLMSFLVVFFVGFVMDKQAVWDEVTNGGTKPWNKKLFNSIYFLIKWVAPISVILIFISNFIL